MIIYQKNKKSYIEDVNLNVFVDILLKDLTDKIGKTPSPSEKRSFENSSRYMVGILSDNEIPDDCGVSIEYNIPSTGKRVDFIITGKNDKDEKLAIIIELKQWEKVEKTDQDGIVSTFINGQIRETLHPSYQAWSYAALLKDFNVNVYENNVGVYPCAYLHNYDKNIEEITNDFYKEHLENAPIFLKSDVIKLRNFIKKFVKKGDDGKLMYEIENGEIRPSKKLADSLLAMMKGNEVFTLIDEQKIVFESVLKASRIKSNHKKVIIIEGGPGTGKSVVAINLLVRLNADRKTCQYVTKNSAPRQVYEAQLVNSFKKSQITNLFKGSGQYIDVAHGSIDVLVVDEAHRLNEKSGMFKNLGDNQVKELIKAAKTTVFFVDENQKVSIHDIGNIEEITKWANEFNADITKMELSSQFRCGGSDGYLAWIDNTLQIRETANIDLSNINYDFKVFDDPSEMRQAIISNNQNNKSRLLAGYCWDWLSKKNPLNYDIEFLEYNFRMRWNLSDDGMLWILKENSVNEVGCIHTCQGLELDYVGVIIGKDMRLENGQIITDLFERAAADSTVRGFKGMYKKDKEGTLLLGDNLIKNTYRTLMTRGQKGCYVYCVDSNLRDYIKHATKRNI